MNSEMQKLTEQGIKENKLMKTLTHQSAQDTRSMMVVALISAVFLPATFLAVRSPFRRGVSGTDPDRLYSARIFLSMSKTIIA